MKSNKKFPPALGAIVDQALKDKSAWIGKTVQELTCEAIKKRGLSQEDTEGCVCLTLKEAKILENFCWRYAALLSTEESIVHNKLFEQIKKVEECDETE